jgi:hypothetical protein
MSALKETEITNPIVADSVLKSVNKERRAIFHVPANTQQIPRTLNQCHEVVFVPRLYPCCWRGLFTCRAHYFVLVV